MTIEEVREYIAVHLNENVSCESKLEQIPTTTTIRSRPRYRFDIVFAWEKNGVKMNYCRRPKKEDIMNVLQVYVEEVNELSS